MAKIRIRQPQIRVGKKGIKLVNVGAGVGGKKARINISRRGASVTAGARGATYNTRRGCLFSPLVLLRLFKRK